MALLKYGPIVADARGSLGGVVFTRSRAGAVARTKTIPTFSPTNSRSTHQSILSRAVVLWRDVLTQEERDSWAVLSGTTLFTNALGLTYRPSSWNLYFRTVALQMLVNFPTSVLAPPVAVAPTPSLTYTQAGGNPFIAFIPVAGHSTTGLTFFWQSTSRRITINFYRGPYPFLSFSPMSTWVDDFPNGLNGPVDFGSRGFIRGRVLEVDGSVSAPFFGSADTVSP